MLLNSVFGVSIKILRNNDTAVIVEHSLETKTTMESIFCLYLFSLILSTLNFGAWAENINNLKDIVKKKKKVHLFWEYS